MSQPNPNDLIIKTDKVNLEDGTARERPVSVSCLLGKAAFTLDPVPHPLALIDEEECGDPMNGFDKGHVIARHVIGAITRRPRIRRKRSSRRNRRMWK